MEKISIGKITLCVNAQINGVHTLTREEDQLVLKQLCKDLKKEWDRKELTFLEFELSDYKRGCLLAGFKIY